MNNMSPARPSAEATIAFNAEADSGKVVHRISLAAVIHSYPINMKTQQTVRFAAASASIFAIATLFADAATTASSPARSDREKETTEWNQWGGSPTRNNTPVGYNLPTQWNI